MITINNNNDNDNNNNNNNLAITITIAITITGKHDTHLTPDSFMMRGLHVRVRQTKKPATIVLAS